MGTWIVGTIITGIVGLASYKVYKDRKIGKGCGAGCESCSCCTGRTNSNHMKPS